MKSLADAVFPAEVFFSPALFMASRKPGGRLCFERVAADVFV